MPSSGSVINFAAGLQSNYDDIESKDLNTLYFCTDSQRIFIGETEYTRPVSFGTNLPSTYTPPNSLFYKSDAKILYFSQDGSSWTQVSNFYTHPSFTQRTLGSQSASTLAWGGTFKVPSITVNNQGHVSNGSDVTLTLPAKPTVSVSAETTGSGNVVTSVEASGSSITVTKGATMATSSELNSVKTTANNAMPKSGGTFTGAVTVPSPTANGHAATKQYVDNAKSSAISESKSYADGLLAANDAMVFKGTIGTGGTVTALPNTHKTGWTYRVVTAGSYAGQPCEVGDLIICITDGTSANNAHWTVAQTNIDGAVTHTAALTADNIVVGNGNGSVKPSTTKISSLATTSQLNNKVDKTVEINGHPLSGDVTISKSDVGLGNVDNTADSSKSVASAAKLTTARTISIAGDATGSTTFDGSKNVTITVDVNTATKATQDGSGNTISTTYATKSELTASKLVWQTF